MGTVSNSLPSPAAAGELGWQSAAIDRLLERFGDVARRAGSAHGLQGDEIDEVLQDVRIRIWHAGADHAKLETMTASYVYRAAVSAAVDMLRRRRARHEQPLDDGTGAAFDVPVHPREEADQHAIADETQLAVAAALATMVPNRRAVVRMFLSGYSREEIGSLLGWSEAKARNLLYRGLDDLRHRLIAKGIHP